MLPVDALKFLAEQAVKATGNRLLKVPAEPDHVYHLIGPDGEVTRHEAAPRPIAHSAGDLDTVAAKVAEHGGEVWYSREKVVGVLDTETRRDVVAFGLSDSPQFARLAAWADAGRGEVAQVELYLLLRTLFAGCLAAHPSLREDVKKVDIKKAQEASGTVNRANVSMSRAMVAEASNADKLPETLTFDVPVFAEPQVPFRAKVRVAFDLDPQTERFRFVVIPGEIEQAYADAEVYLYARVTAALADQGATDAKVFHGVAG